MSSAILLLNKLVRAGENIVSNRTHNLSYISEDRAWVINQVGRELIDWLNKSSRVRARITTTHFGIRNQIIHFGSVNTFLRKDGFLKPHQSNKLVLTWFHFVPDDEKNKNIREAQEHLNIIHTAANLTKKNLINLGVNSEKIAVIPLGVDLSLFAPVSEEERKRIKAKLNISQDKIVIGSFQKDGVGWGEGLKPKKIKGPDIFVDVAAELARDYPIFVLLAGPARGYVKTELKKRSVSYQDIGYLGNFKEIVKYYQALDLYLTTSRIEGGPRQTLEAWAAGVPLVSTKVGMVPDIAEDGLDILLAEVEDIAHLTENCRRIIEDKSLKETLISNGLVKVKNYSWQKIAQRYFEEIYSKLL